MGSWVHGFMGSWVQGFMGSWVHGFNKIIRRCGTNHWHLSVAARPPTPVSRLPTAAQGSRLSRPGGVGSVAQLTNPRLSPPPPVSRRRLGSLRAAGKGAGAPSPRTGNRQPATGNRQPATKRTGEAWWPRPIGCSAFRGVSARRYRRNVFRIVRELVDDRAVCPYRPSRLNDDLQRTQ
jgi:hypothetical protein